MFRSRQSGRRERGAGSGGREWGRGWSQVARCSVASGEDSEPQPLLLAHFVGPPGCRLRAGSALPPDGL